MGRWTALVMLSLLAAGCYRAHGWSESAHQDAGAADATGSCGEPSDPEELARFHELECDPRVFELPATEIELAPGPCPSGRRTTTPFVAAGVWPNLAGGPDVRHACIRVVAASERSGVIAGSIIPSWTAAFAVPFDAADLELELVGVDACDRIVYGRRRLRSSAFEGPRRVLESAEPILAIADARRRTGWIAFATAGAVFLREGEPIEAVGARDLVPGLYDGRAAWLEGSDATRLRVHGAAGDLVMPVHPDARLVRVRGEDETQLLLIEPTVARLYELTPDEVREVRSFSIPAGASNPVVYARALALSVGDAIRVWDLDTGVEREDRGGFEPGDRLIPGLSRPFALRGAVLLPLERDAGLRAPTFRDDAPRLDPETRAAIGPILAVQPMMFDHPLMVVGARGIGVVQRFHEGDAVAPRVYDAITRLGGRVRLARTVWQFETFVLVDTRAGGSIIYDLSHEASGWRHPCEVWD